MLRQIPTITVLLLVYSCGSNHQIKAGAQAELQEAIIASINSNDPIAFKRTFHPSMLEVITESNQPYIDHVIARAINRTIPDSATVRFDSSKTDTAMVSPLPGYTYPIDPTTALVIDYQKAAGSFVSLIIPVVLDGDYWYQVRPMPDPATMERFKTKKIEAHNAETALIDEIAHIDPNLYRRIVDLINESGSLIAAGALYATETGCEKGHGYVVARAIRDKEQRAQPKSKKPAANQP